LVGSNPHSDKEKFCSDLNRSKSCKISEWVLKTLQKFEDFQAEYEGSIPFTRSSLFTVKRVGFIPTNGLLCTFCWHSDRRLRVPPQSTPKPLVRAAREIFSDLTQGFRRLVRLNW
jgi:hypothetical protein